MNDWTSKPGNLGLAAALALLALPAMQAQYNDPQNVAVDPPSRVARVSVLVGSVSVQPASVEQFNVAEPNYPMTTGDRIYADAGANAEIQTGQLAVRLGQQTDLTVTAMTDELAQFGLAQGSAHLRSYNIYQGETVELDTPNVAVTVLQSGDVRVDVDSAADVTTVSVLSGQVQVNGNGLAQVMEPGERLRLSGGNPVYAQLIGGTRPDGLDRFSFQRDGLYQAAFAEQGGYINPGTIGGEDLAAYGSWQDGGDYGAVWYPNGVDADWQPYRNGHWTWVAPWGWTWIEAEPWGFAPFHYGRWARFGPRWGWIPGPAVVRPIYSPALVVFVGGDGFAIGGTRASAWFPLGPGEVYTPWYHASPLYLNRVNVSNIYNRNVAEVRNVYNQRTVVNVYGNGGNRTFVNRSVATVVVPQDSFARGARVEQTALRVNAGQVAAAAVLPHPLITPERSIVASAPARALPPVQQRPALASQQDNRVAPGGSFGGRGGMWFDHQAPNQGQPNVQQRAQPVAAPQQAAPTQQPVPIERPQTPVQQPIQRQQPQTPVQRQQQQPQPQPQPQPQTPVQQPVQRQQQPQQTFQQPTPVRSQAVVPQQAAPQRSQQVTAQPAPPVTQQPQRPLFNQAVPPPARPSFELQQKAIQATDPGRPLSPQQLNNLRQNQAVGQPEVKEMPHPGAAPAPRGGPERPANPNPR